MKQLFRFYILFCLLLPAFHSITAQDSEDEDDYSKLMQRFLNDEKLSPEEYDVLYYAYIFQNTYKGSNQPSVDAAAELALKDQWEQAYDMAVKAIDEHPVSLKLYHLLISISGSVPQAPPNAVEIYKGRLMPLLGAILRSGDGTSKESAFWVNTISDEYIVMRNYLGIDEIKNQRLHEDNGAYFDIFEVEPTARYEEKEIWFDISPSIQYTAGLLE